MNRSSSDKPKATGAGNLKIQISETSNYRIAGSRLVLERACPSHASYILSTFSNSKFWEKYRRNQNRELGIDKLIEKLERDEKTSPAMLGTLEWVVSIKTKEGLQAIGFATLANYIPEQRRAEFLLGLVRDEDAKPGIGLEASLLVLDYAFNIAKLHKLVSIVYSSNMQAQSNTLALGFIQEGLLRKHFFDSKSGKFIDLFQNGMLAEDFRKNSRLGAISERLLRRNVTLVNNHGLIDSIDADQVRKFELMLRGHCDEKEQS